MRIITQLHLQKSTVPATLLSLIWAVAVCLPLPVPAASQGHPILLFDGRTMEGWEGDMKTFRVEDGSIVGGTLKSPIPRNEFLCTRRQFSNFVLRLKFKLLGQGANAGVQFRTRRIPNSHEVIGYQADLGDGWWGALYDESRRNRALAKPAPAEVEKVLRRGDWNSYVIRAEGNRIRLEINGYQMVDYVEREEGIEQSGSICLQIHSGPASEAWYRDITIEALASGK